MRHFNIDILETPQPEEQAKQLVDVLYRNASHAAIRLSIDVQRHAYEKRVADWIKAGGIQKAANTISALSEFTERAQSYIVHTPHVDALLDTGIQLVERGLDQDPSAMQEFVAYAPQQWEGVDLDGNKVDMTTPDGVGRQTEDGAYDNFNVMGDMVQQDPSPFDMEATIRDAVDGDFADPGMLAAAQAAGIETNATPLHDGSQYGSSNHTSKGTPAAEKYASPLPTGTGGGDE